MINRDEWLAAVRAVEPVCDPAAITRGELADMLGLSRTATKERINRMIKDGSARQVMKRVLDSQGRPQTVAAYLLVKRKAK